MPALTTIQIPLGFTAPDFSLVDVLSGEEKSLSQLKGEKGTAFLFICNHCPFVKHVNEALVKLANDYQAKGIGFIAISSNDVDRYPADHPDQMKLIAEQLSYPFPYLYDETQEVAKAYKAVCTPDFSIFDASLQCVYRGQLDDSRPGNNLPVTGADMRAALDQLLADLPINPNQKPSIGCSIKWKGEAPY